MKPPVNVPVQPYELRIAAIVLGVAREATPERIDVAAELFELASRAKNTRTARVWAELAFGVLAGWFDGGRDGRGIWVRPRGDKGNVVYRPKAITIN